jgi:hypothetical protein
MEFTFARLKNTQYITPEKTNPSTSDAFPSIIRSGNANIPPMNKSKKRSIPGTKERTKYWYLRILPSGSTWKYFSLRVSTSELELFNGACLGASTGFSAGAATVSF